MEERFGYIQERKRLRHPTYLETNNVSFSLSESFLSHRNEAHKKLNNSKQTKNFYATAQHIQ